MSKLQFGLHDSSQVTGRTGPYLRRETTNAWIWLWLRSGMTAPASLKICDVVGTGLFSWCCTAPRQRVGHAPTPRSWEKIGKSGTDSPFRAGQLRIFQTVAGREKDVWPRFSDFFTASYPRSRAGAAFREGGYLMLESAKCAVHSCREAVPGPRHCRNPGVDRRIPAPCPSAAPNAGADSRSPRSTACPRTPRRRL